MQSLIIPLQTPLKKSIKQFIHSQNINQSDFLRGPKINIISASSPTNKNEDKKLINKYMEQIKQQFGIKSQKQEHSTINKTIRSTPYTIKTQKKRYLKLFTSINQNQYDQYQQNISRQAEYPNSICNSQLSCLERQYVTFDQNQQIKSATKYFQHSQSLSTTPIQIQQEQKIILDFQIKSQTQIQIHSFHQLSPCHPNLKKPFKKDKQKIKISLSRIQRLNPEVKESYRYCIGCLQPILEANIKSHQHSCASFKKVLQMQTDQFIDFLRRLAESIIKQIQRQLPYLNGQYFKNITNKVDSYLNESELISTTGLSSQIYNFKFKQLQFSSQLFIDFLQNINKLNWFLRIRQKVLQTYKK